jgi:hypothetical protein
MPRTAANVDRNQPEIVEALRAIGCTVQHLHAVGAGCPDILVGRVIDGVPTNFLIEIKDGERKPSECKLNKRQVEWHGLWMGQVAVAKSVNEAIEIVGGYTFDG